MRRHHTIAIRALALSLTALSVTSLEAQVNWDVVRRSTESHLRPILSPRTPLAKWIGQSSTFCYHSLDSQGKRTYYIVDAATGKRELLLPSPSQFVRAFRTFSGDTTLQEEQLELSSLNFEGGQTRFFTFRGAGKKYYRYDRKTGQFASIDKPATPFDEQKPARTKALHPRYTVYGKGYNLYLKDSTTGELRQMTHEGEEAMSFTTQASADTLSTTPRGEWWGDVYLVELQDNRGVGEMTLVNPLSKPRPRAKTFRMPMPFDKHQPQTRLYRYDARTGQGGMVEEVNHFEGGSVSLQLRPDEGEVLFTRRSRLADTLQLCRLNVATGKSQVLITEAIHPHINLTLTGYRLLRNGQIIWWSERTGYGAYYLYDRNGKELRQLTSGRELVAAHIVHIDERAGMLTFAAYGGGTGNPYYRKYYQVGLNGKGQRCLTPDEADHELELAPSGEVGLLTTSRMDLPPRYSTLALKGRSGAHLFDSIPRSMLEAAGWQAPELVRVLSADGRTPLYGVLYRPAVIDSAKRYPLITNVYPGPQTDLVPRSFALDDNGNQSLANMGCYVLNVAARGSSPFRGRDFYCYSVGQLRDYPLADDKTAIEQIAKTHPIDLDRIGIYGHSGGGFQTMAAMCTYPDFYKVGFAASGNHDNNIYINWWGEVFHGSPKIPTTIELAPRLRGKLMLTVGGMDNNVPPASTYRLAQALIKAGKPFEFFLFPDARHDLESPYYTGLLRRFFGEHLLHLSAEDLQHISYK